MIENDIAVNLNESINKITENSNYFIVKATNNIYKTKKIVSTLPPNLLVNTIQFTPSLPDKLINVCNSTHTWMGESIKIALRFPKPFWRNENSSGTIFSNVGPIPEMYDHSNYEDNSYALMGFLNGNYHIKTKAQRQELVLNQLRKYYGNDVDSMLDYHECVWNQEGETYFPYNYPITPHQNNGHSIFQPSYFDNKLLLAGTETSDLFPGYMDGAVRSAQLANQWIRNSLENT